MKNGMSNLVAPTSGKGHRATVNGVSIYYEDQGHDRPVLLLHGGIMDHQSWGNQIPVLQEDFRVIAPDTRGHGRSTDSADPYSYSLFARDVFDLAQALEIHETHVIGFSDGACTAMLLAMDHPDLVQKLVVIGTTYNISRYPPGTIEQYATLTPQLLHDGVGPAFAEVMRKAEALYPTPESWNRFFSKLVRGMWTREPNFELEQLASIQAPTLILYAENEPFYNREDAEEMAAAIRNATLLVVPAATHTSPQENPRAVNAAVLNFLAESGQNCD